VPGVGLAPGQHELCDGGERWSRTLRIAFQGGAFAVQLL
jgi:hypothetical protein